MTDYAAPLRDIAFTLDHVAGLGELLGFERFAHVDRDVVEGLLDESARFVADIIAPLNRVGDEIGSVRNDDATVTTPPGFAEAYGRYVEGGWGSVSHDPEFGGGGFPGVVGVALQELSTSANMAFSMCPLLTEGAVHLLTRHGDDELRRTWLPKLISGEWTGTMNLTEAEAGSDVGALRTRAEPADDGTWRVRGTKIFISWGEHDMADNIVHLVLARVPDAPPGTRGISCFVVPKFLLDSAGAPSVRNEVDCVSIEHKMGIHASPTCVLSFGENEGAVGYLIGEVNQGMTYMFTMMNMARISVGLEGLALAERAYQQALAFACERRQGRAVGAERGTSSPIIEHPDVRRMLMTMKARIEAMRRLAYVNAAAEDRAAAHPDEDARTKADELAQLLTPLTKAWATDMGSEVTSLAIQVHGGMGYIEETGVAQHYRDARVTPIYEGTNGIQAMDLVGRKLPMRAGGVVREHLESVAELEGRLDVGDGRFAVMQRELAAARAATTRATDWLMEHGLEDPRDALAGATPYLRMMSLVTAAALMAEGALAARAMLESGSADAGFLEAKIETAAFFAEQLLPEAVSLLGATTAGAGPLMALDPSQLGD